MTLTARYSVKSMVARLRNSQKWRKTH